MSKHDDGSVYCDYIRCHLFIHPRDTGAIRGLQQQFHGHCWLQLERERKAAANPRPAFVTAMLLALLVVISFNANGQQMYEEKDWKKGAVIIGVKNDGGCVFRPFIQTGIAQDDPDTGEPQILGYEPGNVQISRKGDVIWERTHEARFVPRNGHKTLRGRLCKCPPYNF